MSDWRLTVTVRLADGTSGEWTGELPLHFTLAQAGRYAVDRAVVQCPGAVAITRLTVEPPAETA
jgi:hypothetical protein